MPKTARLAMLSLTAIVLLSDSSWAVERTQYLSRQQVTTAVKEALSREALERITVDEARVSIPSVPVMSRHAVVTVERIECEPRTKVINVRLRCVSSECLPFFVRIADVKSADCADFNFKTRSGIHKVVRAQTVRLGDKAQLRATLPGIKLSMPVVCLQGGAVGDAIRVRRVDSDRVLLGRIESAGVLSPIGRYK